MYHLSTFNHVMKDVLIWNLPAKITCKPSAICQKYCYALATEHRWQNATQSRFSNLKCTKDKDFVDNMVCVMKAQLIKKPMKYCRIHESGDFYNQKYLENWMQIATYFKDMRFLAFTHSHDLNFSNKPKNMEILMSLWKDDDPKKIQSGFPISYTGMRGVNAIHCVAGKDKCNKCGFKCWHLTELQKNVWSKIHVNGKELPLEV